MDRTIKKVRIEEDGQIKWKKLGGGSFKLRNRFIKPGETFLARPDEIPQGVRDVVVPLQALPATASAVQVKRTKKSVWEVQPRGKSKSQFDVVNEAGKKMNEDVLTKEKAELLANDLNK